jgi:SAM-dependent methyltransferase
MRTEADYSRMQKTFYESTDVTAEDVVGNYAWHEQFPYETQLLYRYGDVRYPIIADPATARALDVGCGPGRMISRMRKFFRQVDGVDISSRLLALARKDNPDSEFFESTGADLGDAPSETYEFVYSTIALQHIAVRSIRCRIFEHMKRVLKPGGCFTLQFAYLDTLPYIIPRGGRALRYFGLSRARKLFGHAEWAEDKVAATATNSECDVTIGPKSLGLARADFNALFPSVEHWFYDVRICWSSLRGQAHSSYWPSHWIFFHGVKANV